MSVVLWRRRRCHKRVSFRKQNSHSKIPFQKFKKISYHAFPRKPVRSHFTFTAAGNLGCCLSRAVSGTPPASRCRASGRRRPTFATGGSCCAAATPRHRSRSTRQAEGFTVGLRHSTAELFHARLRGLASTRAASESRLLRPRALCCARLSRPDQAAPVPPPLRCLPWTLLPRGHRPVERQQCPPVTARL